MTPNDNKATCDERTLQFPYLLPIENQKPPPPPTCPSDCTNCNATYSAQNVPQSGTCLVSGHPQSCAGGNALWTQATGTPPPCNWTPTTNPGAYQITPIVCNNGQWSFNLICPVCKWTVTYARNANADCPALKGVQIAGNYVATPATANPNMPSCLTVY